MLPPLSALLLKGFNAVDEKLLAILIAVPLDALSELHAARVYVDAATSTAFTCIGISTHTRRSRTFLKALGRHRTTNAWCGCLVPSEWASFTNYAAGIALPFAIGPSPRESEAQLR